MSDPPNNLQENHNSFGRVVSNTSWLTSTRLVGDLGSLILFAVLSRYFGAVGIGQYAYGFAVGGLVYSVVNLGLEDYGIRECSYLSVEAKRTLIGRLIGTQLVLVVSLAFAAIGIVLVTGSPTERIAIVFILSAYQLMLALARTLFVPAFAEQSMIGPGVAELVCRVLIVCLTVMLVTRAHASLAVALTPFPIGGLLLLALAAMSARRYIEGLSVRMSLRDSSVIVRSAWPFGAAVLVFHVYSGANLMIVSFLLGDGMAGIYASGVKFLQVGTIPLFYLGLAAYPTLSRVFRENYGQMSEAVEQFHRTVLILGGLLAWALLFVVPLVVAPLFGQEFSETSRVVRVMAILGLVIAVETIAIRLLLATHLQMCRVKFQVAASVLNIVLGLVLIPLIGVIGAVVGMIVAEGTLSVVYLRVLWRRIPASTATLIKTVGLFVALLSAAFIVGGGFNRLDVNSWLPAVASLATFAAGIMITGFVQVSRWVRKPNKRNCLSAENNEGVLALEVKKGYESRGSVGGFIRE